MLSLLLISAAALAQTPVADEALTDERSGGAFGLGVAVGAPTGVTGRLWLGSGSALQFSAGGDLGAPNSVATTMDYVLFFRPFEIEDDAYSIPLYFGGGINADASLIPDATRVLVGPRAVFGASLLVPDLPIEVYGEIAPSFVFGEFVGWTMDGQLGFRNYF